MQTAQFEYDIALSFVAKDESIATQLTHELEGRLKVFLYSRQQEQLAGTDGEKTFNEVFSKQARLVVVLYRDGWGQTPWTRIEETAIRNRAFDEGYNFVVFIPLDEKPSVPKWLPKSQLWIGLSRWGIQCTASVIDARFQELGGEPKSETLADRAAKLERVSKYQTRRASYLESDKGVRCAIESFVVLQNAILNSIPDLMKSAPSLSIKSKKSIDRVVLLCSGPALLVTWQNRYINSLKESKLEASIWQGHPPFPGAQTFYPPNCISTVKMSPDLDENDNHAWSVKTQTGLKLMNSVGLSEFILNWWLDKIENHNKK